MAWGSPWADQRQGPPRVNLLPGEIHERRLVRRQRAAVGTVLVLLLALLGLWYTLQTRELAEARRAADGEEAVAASLRARKTQLQPYAVLEGQIAAAEQLKAKVYAQEIRFSGVLRDIAAIVPDNVWLTKMTATLSDATTQAGASGAAAAGTSGTAASSGPEVAVAPGTPGAGSPVANVSFSGAGFGHVDVGTFLQALAAGPRERGQPVYLNPYFTSSQESSGEGGQETVTFSATVDLSSAAYSGRFQAPGQKGTVTP